MGEKKLEKRTIGTARTTRNAVKTNTKRPKSNKNATAFYERWSNYLEVARGDFCGYNHGILTPRSLDICPTTMVIKPLISGPAHPSGFWCTKKRGRSPSCIKLCYCGLTVDPVFFCGRFRACHISLGMLKCFFFVLCSCSGWFIWGSAVLRAASVQIDVS